VHIHQQWFLLNKRFHQILHYHLSYQTKAPKGEVDTGLILLIQVLNKLPIIVNLPLRLLHIIAKFGILLDKLVHIVLYPLLFILGPGFDPVHEAIRHLLGQFRLWEQRVEVFELGLDVFGWVEFLPFVRILAVEAGLSDHGWW
jgi:hypothetical protein